MPAINSKRSKLKKLLIVLVSIIAVLTLVSISLSRQSLSKYEKDVLQYATLVDLVNKSEVHEIVQRDDQMEVTLKESYPPKSIGEGRYFFKFISS